MNKKQTYYKVIAPLMRRFTHSHRSLGYSNLGGKQSQSDCTNAAQNTCLSYLWKTNQTRHMAWKRAPYLVSGDARDYRHTLPHRSNSLWPVMPHNRGEVEGTSCDMYAFKIVNRIALSNNKHNSSKKKCSLTEKNYWPALPSSAQCPPCAFNCQKIDQM